MAVGRSQKIPTALINYPALGFDCFHHGGDTCPSYPGLDPIAAMVPNERIFLVMTIHVVTDVIDGGQFVAPSSGCSTASGALRRRWQCSCPEARYRTDSMMSILRLSALPHASKARRRNPKTETRAALAGAQLGSHNVARGASARSRRGSRTLPPSHRGRLVRRTPHESQLLAFGAEWRMLRE